MLALPGRSGCGVNVTRPARADSADRIAFRDSAYPLSVNRICPRFVTVVRRRIGCPNDGPSLVCNSESREIDYVRVSLDAVRFERRLAEEAGGETYAELLTEVGRFTKRAGAGVWR